MPRASKFTKQGNRFLRRRFDTKRKGTRTYTPRDPERVRLPDGTVLNIPESKIFQALVDLGENPSAQQTLRGGSTFSGAMMDVTLEDKKLDFEYQGPFHDTTDGAAKDFWRRVTREQYGYTLVYIYERDLNNIHDVLRRYLNFSFGAAISTRR